MKEDFKQFRMSNGTNGRPSLSLTRLFGVADKIVLISGGSRGIGEMMTRAFVENGAHVIICSRKAAAVDKVVQEMTASGFPGTCRGFPADLSSRAECERAGEEAAKLCGEIVAEVAANGGVKREACLDVLINNSGATWGEPIEQYKEQGWDKIMNLNVKGVFFLTRYCLPLLEKAATRQSPARVINVGSIAGLRNQYMPTYSYDASKAAVHHLTTHLASHLSSRNILVNAIAPGFVKSSMSDQILTYAPIDAINSSIPCGRIGGDKDMAGIALYLSSDSASWVTGAIIPVDGGALVFQPTPKL